MLSNLGNFPITEGIEPLKLLFAKPLFNIKKKKRKKN